jgi:hypothetical protein
MSPFARLTQTTIAALSGLTKPRTPYATLEPAKNEKMSAEMTTPRLLIM